MGLDDFLTDIGAIERVSQGPGTECRVFLPKGVGEGGRFHPKLYVFHSQREESVIVGSVNLSVQGLETNHEASVWLRGEPDDPVIRSIQDSFSLPWNSPRAVPLTQRVRRDYEEIKRSRDQALADVVHLDQYRRWAAALRANVARALIRPSSRRWLMITSPTNFAICLRLGRWGDERYERIARVQPGDGIVFYVTSEHTLGAVAVAVGPARVSQERPWPDRPYPFQMDIQFLAVADPRPSIRPHIRDLDLFGRSELGWGQRLQTTLRRITERDFGILAQAVGLLDVGSASGEADRGT